MRPSHRCGSPGARWLFVREVFGVDERHLLAVLVLRWYAARGVAISQVFDARVDHRCPGSAVGACRVPELPQGFADRQAALRPRLLGFRFLDVDDAPFRDPQREVLSKVIVAVVRVGSSSGPSTLTVPSSRLAARVRERPVGGELGRPAAARCCGRLRVARGAGWRGARVRRRAADAVVTLGRRAAALAARARAARAAGVDDPPPVDPLPAAVAPLRAPGPLA